ncbi:MAG: methyltransferase [Muribaculaceae bacterium]|nr:methyltransferase [Muribaculaceae bacterium]
MGREKVFRFKQFEVLNDRTAMKVGTDGVLLGAWCDVQGARRVLDVGTGCGVIALMVAQRNAAAQIDAIEIDEASALEAGLNFERSPWAERLHLVHGDFTAVETWWSGEKYDLIVSNPPFFTHGVLPPEASRMTARHTQNLDYGQLLKVASAMLADEGKIALITPFENIKGIVEESTFNSLNISKKFNIISVKGFPPKRVLWELCKEACEMKENELVIEDHAGCFSDDYVTLCKDFYLKM